MLVGFFIKVRVAGEVVGYIKAVLKKNKECSGYLRNKGKRDKMDAKFACALGIKDYTSKHLESYIEKYRSGFQYNKEKIVPNILGNIKEKKVLDIGCGCGVFSYHCYSHGAEVFSIDFSPIMVGFAKKPIRILM